MEQTDSSVNRGRSRDAQPPWLRRLWERERVPLSQAKLHWWGIHVQRFLAYVRREQLEGPPGPLVERLLSELQVRQPPVTDWQLDQVRQALGVFVRGIENWHFERDISCRSCSGI